MNEILSTPGWRTRALARLPAAGQDRHHTFRQVELVQHLGQPHRIQRSLRGGLDHHGATGDQRGDHLRHDQHLGDVPRHDRADDADGSAAHLNVAEQALSSLDPAELLGGGQGQVHLRQRPVRLPQPAEAARRPHLGRDEIGHLLRLGGVERSASFSIFSIRSETGSRGHGPSSNALRAAVTARSTSSRSRFGCLADRFLGVRGDDRDPLAR